MDKPQETELVWLLTVTIGIMALLAVVIILFVILHQKRKLIHQITLQRLENEYHKQSLASNIQAQENERRRIAKDLHDEVGAVLSTSKLYITYLAEESSSTELAHKVEELLDVASQNLRSIAHNMTPQNLEKFGLVHTLNRMSEQISASNTIQARVYTDFEERLVFDQELCLYRIASELINNTIKHAQASEITISLCRQDQQVTFTYQDNGRGMDLENTPVEQQGGHGLQNLTSRAELLNTSIVYDSKPQQGFKASLCFST